MVFKVKKSIQSNLKDIKGNQESESGFSGGTPFNANFNSFDITNTFPNLYRDIKGCPR